MAEKIPRQVGIKAGAIVEGFVRGGHKASDIERLVASKEDAKVGAQITLGQLAKKHKINLEKDTLVMEKQARYCSHLCKLDTKDYGLPQTRNRKVRSWLDFFNLLESFHLICGMSHSDSVLFLILRYCSTFLFGEATIPTMI